MLDNASQVNGCFNAGVATTDYGYRLTLEQGAITVWAVGHTFAPVLLFAGNIHFTPAGTRGEHHRFAAQRHAVADINADKALLVGAEAAGKLSLHNIDVVTTDVRFQVRRQFWPLGF